MQSSQYPSPGVQYRIDDELVILLYHGVTRSKSYGIENFSGKHISDKNFFNQMKYISKFCNPISINDVVEIRARDEDYPPRSVLVSFDDGFENNYSVAAPILDELQVPAVFYITSGIVNTDLMFWVDIVEDCINLCGKDTISILLEKKYTLVLGSEKNKIDAVRFIKAYCKSGKDRERDRVISDLIKETEISPSVDHADNYKKINWRQLQELSGNVLFTIGGHSLFHEILSELDQQRLTKNIQLSIKLLEYQLSRKIEHYSYPEGQQSHYNEVVIDELKNANILCSPSAIEGTNDKSIDLFNLRRIMVGFEGIPFPYLLHKS